jgi:FXSXX-COOH protein
MMSGVSDPVTDGDSVWRPLIDVSGVSLAELTNRGDDVIARAVRQVLRSLDDPNGVISAFESFVET